MLILFITLFLSLNLQAGQHGPMDPPVVPEYLLRNPRAEARTSIKELRQQITACEEHQTLMANNPAAQEILEGRIAAYKKDIERLDDQESQPNPQEIVAIIMVSILFGATMHVYHASQANPK